MGIAARIKYFAVSALVLSSALPAHAARVDLSDPSVLGSVVLQQTIPGAGFEFPWYDIINQVRYVDGIYSYVYAVRTDPYFPSTIDGEPEITSLELHGRPLEETWGAIYTNSFLWGGFPTAQTNVVVSMTATVDGVLVVPNDGGAGSITVFYMQSLLYPVLNGTMTYNARNYTDQPYVPVREYVYDSKQLGPLYVPVPEPATIVLFSLGAAAVAGQMRARRKWRRGGPTGGIHFRVTSRGTPQVGSAPGLTDLAQVNTLFGFRKRTA